MEKTANYGLPKWEKSDFIKMDDVNATFGKIDETLKANADAAGGKAEAETVTAIAQTIASSKICRAKFGTYTGTGLSGQNHPNSVECGFCPALLVLFRADGGQKTTVIRGVTACSSGIGSMNNYYTWGDSGVSWVSETLQSDSGGYMASSQFNSSGKEYCYLVLGYDADWIKQKNSPEPYKGAHKTVILKITIMTSVRQGWQRNNGYLVKAGYPLFFCRHEKQ